MGSEKVKIVLRDLLLLFILVAGHTNAKEFSLCEYGPRAGRALRCRGQPEGIKEEKNGAIVWGNG
jgi:hypothetical protein